MSKVCIETEGRPSALAALADKICILKRDCFFLATVSTVCALFVDTLSAHSCV